MKVLVTGATGFLGAHVVRGLIAEGESVLAAFRGASDTWRLGELSKGVTMVRMDLLDIGSVSTALEEHRPDAVIHSAAYGVNHKEQDPAMASRVNMKATRELVEAAAASGVKRFVHIGSCFEYGDKDHPIREDEDLAPTGVYGAAKAAGTLAAIERAAELGLSLTVLRPFSMWGVLEPPGRLVPQVISACMERTPLRLTGGEQVRDYSHVTDIAEMIVRLLKSEGFPESRILNLGSGTPVLLKDFVLKVVGALGADPALMEFGKLEYRGDEMWRLVADTTNISGYTRLPEMDPASFRDRVLEQTIELRDNRRFFKYEKIGGVA